jgi:hypothetical protein
MVTIYSDIYSKKAHHRPLEFVLSRISDGNSKLKIQEIRNQLDKERSNTLKRNLPSICFSGTFGDERTDGSLIKHSGFIVLDFDNIYDVQTKKAELIKLSYCYACWISPGGNGLKMLVKIADGSKHIEHFQSLKKDLPEIDDSGKNVSRVCYESFDPELFINKESSTYAKTLKKERIEIKERVEDSVEIFNNIFKWLTNRGNAFVTGERNAFIFKLASACCRFGMSEECCQSHCDSTFVNQDSSFSQRECHAAIRSAFRGNRQMAGTATFERDVLIDKLTKGEVKDEINPDIYNEDIRPKDVIFGEDVKDRALEIFRNGYESVESTGVPELDYFFKFKRGEITLLSGIGNYGKSTMLKYLLLLKAIVSGNRFAFFTPEDNPAEEFYHDMTEIYLGCDCTKFNPNQPSEKTYKDAYDWISKHIFYIYPKDISPTPEYIKERFLELIIKEKVDGCVIDPFNQMDNNYSKTGRTDKYLETFLSDCTRFAQTNNVYFIIVAHPHKLKKEQGEKNYPCPDVYEIADGAMWNNKMDNILIYHRPNHQTEPDSPICELHTKKIRRQKTVGRKGIFTFELNRPKRRYIFDGKDYMAEYIYNDKSIPQAYSLRDMLEPLPLDQVPF